MKIRIPSALFLIVPSLILVLSAAGCGDKPHSGYSEILPADAIESLNATIRRADLFHRQKETALDSVKAMTMAAEAPVEKWKMLVDISERYRQTDADSAIRYAARALDLRHLLPDSVNNLRGELAFIDALSTAGIFPPALQRLDSIQHTLSSTSDKISYWKSARRCYSYIMTWVGNHDYYRNAYRKRYLACDDSLLSNLPPSDPFRRFISCERMVNEQRWSEARNQLESLLKSLPGESNLYAMAAYQMATVQRYTGDPEGYCKYLAIAAESDIKGSVREGLALPSLANWMYEHGYLDNAFRYVTYTLEDANSGNIRMRTTAIAPIIPLIDTAIQRRSKTSRNQMLAYIIITTILFISTIILLVFTFSSLKKLRMSQTKLEASSKKLEAYVGNFISLCSNYAGRLDQLSKLVTRKISSGQSEDLLKLVSTGKFAEADDEEFYRLIDKALLDIFPDFIGQINSLLRPECKITIDNDAPLSPDLRIYAFVRLGVDQSSRIAQILGYSVNTVYAYRNRMRNRAIDHDNFDSLVAQLP